MTLLTLMLRWQDRITALFLTLILFPLRQIAGNYTLNFVECKRLHRVFSEYIQDS
ncbi:hypothetical protein [Vibrio mangrovi]|uniref:hypothetical protein n=1 Tax=Vibrio mangrovi TaxID=474394 RepID=UPI0013565BD3|nr:hypothetical protein [Vibrio mangrovi]